MKRDVQGEMTIDEELQTRCPHCGISVDLLIRARGMACALKGIIERVWADIPEHYQPRSHLERALWRTLWNWFGIRRHHFQRWLGVPEWQIGGPTRCMDQMNKEVADKIVIPQLDAIRRQLVEAVPTLGGSTFGVGTVCANCGIDSGTCPQCGTYWVRQGEALTGLRLNYPKSCPTGQMTQI